MVQVVGPCFSLDAVGLLGDAISFFTNRWGSIAGYYRQGQKRRPRAFSELQRARQLYFSEGVRDYRYMDPAFQDLWKDVAKGEPASGRCLFMQAYLNWKGLNWRFAPYPPQLWLEEMTSKVILYDQIIAGLETLTGVNLLYKPTVVATKDLLTGYNAVSAFVGDFFMIREEDRLIGGFYLEVETVAHELMHCLLDQHSYFFYDHPDTHAIMATECAKRVKDGDLVPIYKYQGKTTQEIIDGQLF